MLWLVPGRSSLQATTSQNVLTSKFTVNQLHIDFKAKQVVLQSKVGIIKWGSFNYKVEQLLISGATFNKKWSRYYKEGIITAK